MAFAGAYLAFYTVGAWVFATIAGSSGAYQPWRLASAASALPIAAGAIWLAGHVRLPFTSALAPTGLAAGTLPLVLLLTATGTWHVAHGPWPPPSAAGGR